MYLYDMNKLYFCLTIVIQNHTSVKNTLKITLLKFFFINIFPKREAFSFSNSELFYYLGLTLHVTVTFFFFYLLLPIFEVTTWKETHLYTTCVKNVIFIFTFFYQHMEKNMILLAIPTVSIERKLERNSKYQKYLQKEQKLLFPKYLVCQVYIDAKKDNYILINMI